VCCLLLDGEGYSGLRASDPARQANALQRCALIESVSNYRGGSILRCSSGTVHTCDETRYEAFVAVGYYYRGEQRNWRYGCCDAQSTWVALGIPFWVGVLWIVSTTVLLSGCQMLEPCELCQVVIDECLWLWNTSCFPLQRDTACTLRLNPGVGRTVLNVREEQTLVTAGTSQTSSPPAPAGGLLPRTGDH
jgi:hypothetical protein